MNISAYMLSCPERESIRQQTLANLDATDWNDSVWVEIDQTTFERKQERQEQTALRLLERASAGDADVILFLEDDLQFNRHLRHNLEHWAPLQQIPAHGYFFGSLYNPSVRAVEQHSDHAFFIADPNSVYGSQAFILSTKMAQYIVAHWYDLIGMQDMKMSRLAASLGPIFYHAPSLVQHAGAQSVWGGYYHKALDFEADWKSPRRRIVILTLYDDQYAEVGALGALNKTLYAEKHGYAMVCEQSLLDPTRSPAWNKIALIQRHLPRYDWAFWTDADSLIMNSGIKLEQLVEDDFDLIMSQDVNGLNSGQFLIKKSDWSLHFLSQVYHQEQFIQDPWWEQAAMAHVLATNAEHQQHVKYIAQNRINSYVSNYRSGDFIIHFAGYGRDKPNLLLTMREWFKSSDLQDLDHNGQAHGARSSQTKVNRVDILKRMHGVEGWFDDAEADFLITAAQQAAHMAGEETTLVEIGSYCGKSTIILGMAIKQLNPSAARVYAIDPHDGRISSLDRGIEQLEPTFERFSHNISEAGIANLVVPIVACSCDVEWDKPIDLLLVDGFHDYDHVAADFNHFAKWIRSGGRIAFHDCADYFPGVKRFVRELLGGDDYSLVGQVKNLALLEKR